MKKEGEFGKLHAMESFGIVEDQIHKIRVTRLEERISPKVPFPHKHNFYFLMYVTAGSGWHEIDFTKHRVHSGAVYFMEPSQVHAWHLSPEARGIIIEFQSFNVFLESGEFNFLENILQKIPAYQNQKMDKTLQIFFEQALTDYEKKSLFFEGKTKALLTYLMLNLGLQKVDKALHKNNEFIKNFTDLLEKHYQRSGELSFYAKKMNAEDKSFSEKLKRLTGKSFRHHYQDRLILEAKRLLAYSNFTVAEIAIKLGFLDLNYFSRLFKKITATTPTDFRLKNRKLDSSQYC